MAGLSILLRNLEPLFLSGTFGTSWLVHELIPKDILMLWTHGAKIVLDSWEKMYKEEILEVKLRSCTKMQYTWRRLS